jgi:predicted NAD/FAD-binding protein
MSHERIAVIGSGIAGPSGASLLTRRYDLTLFEAQDWLGGHTHTVDITAQVDTGFVVFNDRRYPNLNALFDLLGVESAPNAMSFGVGIDEARVDAGHQPADWRRHRWWARSYAG